MPESFLLTCLPDKERERLRPYLEPVFLDFKQGLLERDEPIPYVWFPHGAVTSTVVNSPDGSTIEVGLMGAEGMIGLSLLYGVETSNATVVVQMPGRAARMRASDFNRQVVEMGGPLLRLLLRYANYFAAMVQQHAACNSVHPLEERMCRWILLTRDRVQRNEFPLTQDYLAQMLGVRRPTVSKVASGLKREGLINYTRGSITVTDRKGLEEHSCECYEIIREQVERTFDGRRPGKR